MASPDMTDEGNNAGDIPEYVQDSSILCLPCYEEHSSTTHHELPDRGTMPPKQQLPDDTLTYADDTPPTNNPDTLKYAEHTPPTNNLTTPCYSDNITDMSDQIIDSPDYNNTIDRIDKLLNKCSKVKAKTLKYTNMSNDSLQNALLEITKYREEINKRIDELQNKLESEIQDLQEQNDERKHAADKICKDVTKDVKLMHEQMKKLNTSKQADQLFVEIKQVQKQLQDYEQSMGSVSKEEGIEEYEFVPNQAICEALTLQHEKGIGSISTKHSGHVEPSRSSIPSLTSVYTNICPTNQHEICVKTEEDKQRCWITGMTMLGPDRLVLVDYNNNSIKLVNVDSKTITAQLSLGSEYVDTPCDVTSTTSTQVAVTVPDRQHIQFISVSDKLSKTHTIQTDGNCSQIASFQNKLIVTYSDPGKLDILDMNGKLITRVKTDAMGKDVFNQPTYVQANSDSIYVCEYRKVLRLAWSGEITGTFRDLGDPAGLAVLGDGSVLVCDYSGTKIHQVSGDCTNGSTVLHDLRCPLTVCVDSGARKLYISRYTRTYGYVDNSILGYNL